MAYSKTLRLSLRVNELEFIFMGHMSKIFFFTGYDTPFGSEIIFCQLLSLV